MAFSFTVYDVRSDYSLQVLTNVNRSDPPGAVTLRMWNEQHDCDAGSVLISSADAMILGTILLGMTSCDANATEAALAIPHREDEK